MAKAPAAYGRDTSGTYRPFDYSRPRKSYVEATDPNAYSGLLDSYRDSYIGSTWNWLEREFAGGQAPEGWDALDHVPEGYEAFANAFINVTTPEQLDLTKRQIDERLALRQRREQRGFWSTFGSDLTAGIFDPSNLIAGPALKGIGVIAGAGKGALFGATMGGVQESIVWATDPSMQPEEGRARVLGGLLGGTALGGVIGGAVGAAGRGGAAAAAPAPARAMTRDQTIRFVLMDLEGGDKLVDHNDGGGLTKFGITANNNPEMGDISKITYDQAAGQARKKYWLKEFDKLDPRIAAIAFDAHYINSADTARAIAKARSVDEALAIYRAKLNWIADNVEGKAQWKKGWNNRVDKLARFVGSDGRPLNQVGPIEPRGIDLDGRGYIKIVNGPTGIYDEAGNYVPAAWVQPKRGPIDDLALVDVPPRPERFETVAEQQPVVEVAAPAQPRTAGRPKVRPSEEPPRFEMSAPRTPKEAAVELDRLERGDATAVRAIVRGGADPRKAILDRLSGLGKERADAHEMLEGDALAEFLEASDKASASLLAELEQLGGLDGLGGAAAIRKRVADQDYDGLPFALAQASKQLAPEDAAFLTDVVEAKGLIGMSQPELNQLYRIVTQLPDINPEAAKLWMGRAYTGGKISRGAAKKRIDELVARRHGLREQAPDYQRDVAEFDYDELRDNLDRAMDERVDQLNQAIIMLDDLRVQKREKVAAEVDELPDDLPNRREVVNAIRRSWQAAYDEAISLAKERIYRVRDKIDGLRQERATYFGQAVGIDSIDESFDVRWRPDQVGKEPPEDLKAIWQHDKEKQFLAQFSSSELRNMIQEKQSALLDLERGAERWVGRDKQVVMTRAQERLFKTMTQEMNALVNRLHQVEAFEREIGDTELYVPGYWSVMRVDNGLPFRLPSQRNGVRTVDPDAPHIAIDVEALLDAFPNKPWTQPVHGLPGMAEDAFQHPEEWVNFVFLHEREHVQNPRMEGESIADYEQRINDRALAALRGGEAPWKPVDGWKERLVLAPTPIGQLMRLVSNPTNAIWQSIATLASDFDVRLQRNVVTGGASAAGGSVFQKTMRHVAKAADYYNKVEDLYLVYARGRASDSGAAGRAFATVRASRKAGRKGLMTFDEFDRAVGKTQATGQPHAVKEVNEAASLFDSIVKDMRRQEDELGLLPGKEQIELEANALKSHIAALEKMPRLGASGSAVLQRMKDRLAALEVKKDKVTATPGKKGLPYFTRVWNPAAMLKDPERIQRIFKEAFVRNGQDPDGAAASAKQLFDQLVADPTGQSIEVGALPGELRSREIPVENDEVVDFIHQDSTIILARYMRRNGAAIEMTRAFGDPSGDLEADRVLASLEADGLDEGELYAAMQIWYDARDRIVGGFHGDNPMSTGNRVVRFAKRWTRFAVMGLSGISQITDLARAAWVVGPNSFAKGVFAPLFHQMAGVDPGRYASAVAEGIDVELGLMARRMMDDDDWTMRVSETGVERLMGDLEVPFFILNGVTPFTNLMKRGVARAVPHLVIDRARRVAAAVQSGKAVPEDDATWLREHGIDEHDAQLLVKLPVQESKGGFIMADLDEWAAAGEEGLRGADLLMGAISGNVRRAVATPGPLNRPRIMDGIMIDKKARKAAWEDRWVAEEKEAEARRYVKGLRKQGFGEGDREFDVAIQELIDAAGVHKRARLNVGSKARKERPFLSLPFQLQSFAFSQSSKLLHGMASGRDKKLLVGVMSLWAAGIVSSWLKSEAGSWFTGEDNNATLDEHIMRGFTQSGVLSWMSIPLEGAKGLARVAIGETKLGDVELIQGDRPGATDNIGMLGPTIGLGVGMLEGMFGTGFDGQDLPASDRVYQLRRMLPFGNMIYFNWLVRRASGLVEGEGAAPVPLEPIEPVDPFGETMEGMMGFSFGDTDPRAPVPEVDEGEEIDTEPLDTEALIARMVARRGKKPRAPRVDAIPVAQRF